MEQFTATGIHTLFASLFSDSSSCNDVFVGYTDRAVGVFRWNRNSHSLEAITERLPLAGQVIYILHVHIHHLIIIQVQKSFH